MAPASSPTTQPRERERVGSPRSHLLSSAEDHDTIGSCELCERADVYSRRYSCSHNAASAKLCRGCYALIAPHQWPLREAIVAVRESVFAISRAPSLKAPKAAAAVPVL